jgi:hypothetical protein
MKPLGWALPVLLIWSGLGASAWASGPAGGHPSTSAYWTAESNRVGAGFGSPVASAGDVNGDGYIDVIVGAEGYDNGLDDEGRVFVFHGSAHGLSTAPNWKAESNQHYEGYHTSLASAGDVNGDGYDDVILGESGYENGEFAEGRARVYLGSPSGLSSAPDWTAESNQVEAYFGGSVAGAGDVNGDGYDDVIVGAEGYDNGLEDEGRVFVFYGSAGGLSQTPNWTAHSMQRYAYFGASVASAGDVNGDGYDDVIIGALFYAEDRGKAFVFHGSPGGLSQAPNWKAGPNQDHAYFYHVASAGDVNGDSYDDVIVGAGGYSNGQHEEGGAFVFHGSPDGLSTTPNWTAESNQESGYFERVASAGDVNGDGFDDVVVGAGGYDHGQTDEGKAFVFHGSAGGLSHTPNWTGESNQALAGFGYSVAGAGDVNGDGYDDVIVGASGYDHGQTGEGLAFVFNGSEGGLTG